MSSIPTEQRPSLPDPGALAGFSVEALDGHIGKVDEASVTVAGSDLVVDTGRWIFKKRRVIPRGVITEIDLDSETVQTSMTKGQVKYAQPYHDPDTDDLGFGPGVGRSGF